MLFAKKNPTHIFQLNNKQRLDRKRNGYKCIGKKMSKIVLHRNISLKQLLALLSFCCENVIQETC